MATDFDRFIRQLKEIVDEHTEFDYQAHGPMRIRTYQFNDDKGKLRHGIKIESGWDWNYGGWVAVEASPTGKSLTVQTSSDPKPRTLPSA